MLKLKTFIKNEIVLVISFVLAVVSAFIITPDRKYIDYIDYKTLSLLFCLMVVMAGLNNIGVFKTCAEKLLSKTKSVKSLSLILCLMCFFSSMIITNDVALITFVPFTIITLKISSNEKSLIPLIAVETVAANLGSMLTPIGNPQNLYLFSFFEMKILSFFKTIIPYAAVSLLLVCVAALFTGKGKLEYRNQLNDNSKINIRPLLIYAVLFILSLLTVFRVIPFYITLAVTVVTVLAFDRKTLLKIDYSLLLTFTFLFVFIGNLGNIESVSAFLKSAVTGNEVLVGIISSQVFSNVPAALLLSGFTDNAEALLVGVNLGGLGTLIASMASLISFKLIAKENIKTGKYMLVFTLINIAFLAVNILLWIIIDREVI